MHPEIVIRKNRAGPQRYKYVLRTRTGHVIMQSRSFRSRATALQSVRLFLRVIQQGVTFHE